MLLDVNVRSLIMEDGLAGGVLRYLILDLKCNSIYGRIIILNMESTVKVSRFGIKEKQKT